MSVLYNVTNLETSRHKKILKNNVVIRNSTEPFWKACLAEVDATYPRRVCAIGTPGIGKTTSTAYLIRLLLMRSKQTTIVYRMRAGNEAGFCYEFCTDGKGGKSVSVFPERNCFWNIPSLQNNDTYYIVDPCQTTTSCNPPADFMAKVIIVTSPNSIHWGGSSFGKTHGPPTKDVNTGDGLFMYMPVWTYDELESASAVLSNITIAELSERYNKVGGVPRQMFAARDTYENFLQKIDNALNNLSPDQVEKLAWGRLDEVGTLDEKEPKSSIIVVENKSPSDFKTKKIILRSKNLQLKFWRRYSSTHWSNIEDGDNFQTYVQILLNMSIRYQARLLNNKTASNDVLLGNCSIQPTSMDLLEASHECTEPNVLFTSNKINYPLYDMCYRDSSNRYHLIQATMAGRHSANPILIKETENNAKKLGIPPDNLTLYYAVHSARYDNFKTDPAFKLDKGRLYQENTEAKGKHVDKKDESIVSKNNINKYKSTDSKIKKKEIKKYKSTDSKIKKKIYHAIKVVVICVKKMENI